MKKLLFIFMTFCTIGVQAQKIDTVQLDVKKEGGFERIREFHRNGELKRVVFTTWQEDGKYEISITEYNTQGKTITNKSNTYNNEDIKIKSTRKIGDSIERDEQYFDDSGALISRNISIHINNKYLVFQKYWDNEWKYRTIVDGTPPDYIPLNKERFEEVVKLYNDLLLFHKIID